MLKHLLSRGTECPKVLSATHFHELFTHPGLLDISLPIGFYHMQILIPDEEDLGSAIHADDGMGEEERREAERTKAHLRLLRGETITYLYR